MDDNAFHDLPWKIITEMQFQRSTLKIWITFRSGTVISATAPDIDTWDQILSNATVRLGSDKITFK